MVKNDDSDLPYILTVTRLAGEFSVFDRFLAMVLATAPDRRALAAADRRFTTLGRRQWDISNVRVVSSSMS
jgi:hypothetical protein